MISRPGHLLFMMLALYDKTSLHDPVQERVELYMSLVDPIES